MSKQRQQLASGIAAIECTILRCRRPCPNCCGKRERRILSVSQKPTGSWSESDRGGTRLWEKVYKDWRQWKDFGPDRLSEALRGKVREMIMTLAEAELAGVLAAGIYERRE